jgi:hypothetical protein
LPRTDSKRSSLPFHSTGVVSTLRQQQDMKPFSHRSHEAHRAA